MGAPGARGLGNVRRAKQYRASRNQSRARSRSPRWKRRWSPKPRRPRRSGTPVGNSGATLQERASRCSWRYQTRVQAGSREAARLKSDAPKPAQQGRPEGQRPPRPQGDRPPREPRPQGDRPQGDRPQGGDRGPRPGGGPPNRGRKIAALVAETVVLAPAATVRRATVVAPPRALVVTVPAETAAAMTVPVSTLLKSSSKSSFPTLFISITKPTPL